MDGRVDVEALGRWTALGVLEDADGVDGSEVLVKRTAEGEGRADIVGLAGGVVADVQDGRCASSELDGSEGVGGSDSVGPAGRVLELEVELAVLAGVRDVTGVGCGREELVVVVDKDLGAVGRNLGLQGSLWAAGSAIYNALDGDFRSGSALDNWGGSGEAGEGEESSGELHVDVRRKLEWIAGED